MVVPAEHHGPRHPTQRGHHVGVVLSSVSSSGRDQVVNFWLSHRAACCTSSNTRVTRVSQTRALVPPRAPRCKPYSCASCQSLCGRVYASGGRSRPAGHAMMTCQVIIRSSARVDVVHRQALSCQVCAVWADECDSDAYAACAARNASVCAAR